MVKKFQVPVIGGLRKVIRIPDATQSNGTTIAGYESQTLTLQQLKALLGTTPTTPNTVAPGATAALVPGQGLAGGGSITGSVPLYFTAPIPVFFDSDGGGGGDGDPGPPGNPGVAGAPGPPGAPAVGANVLYGIFASSANQTNPVANAMNLMTLNTTLAASGISVVSSTKITFATAGTYQIALAAQFINSGAAALVDYWLQKNGTAVTGSDQEEAIQSGAGNYATVNPTYIVTVVANDYVELAWASSSTNTSLSAQAASAPQPDSPSVLVNVSMLIYSTPGAQGPSGYGSIADDTPPDDPIIPAYQPRVTRVNKGAAWVSPSGALTNAVGIVYVSCPVAGTIRRVKVVTTGGAGSCVIDVWKAQFASFPPLVGNTITAAALPTISAGTTYQDSTLTGWTTTINAGDVLAFKLNSVSTFTAITIVLEIDQ